MAALFTKIAGDLRRHPTPAIVVAFIMALAVGVGTLGLALLDQSSAPFDRAFAQQQGAHLLAIYRGTDFTPDQLLATTKVDHVTAAAGPWQLVYVDLATGTQKAQLAVIGRTDPAGPVNRLDLVAGRWVNAPGEIVLTRSFAQITNLHLGDQVRPIDQPGMPLLRVVGEVLDINEGEAGSWTPQSAWVLPAQLPALTVPGDTPKYQMVYRLDSGSASVISSASQRITAAAPAGSVAVMQNYQLVKSIDGLTTTILLTFLLAFAAFALGAAALIVANIVAGTVLAQMREIGVTKALGFTPGQVVLVYLGQMLFPALVGGLIGIPFGMWGSAQIISQSTAALDLPSVTDPPVISALLALAGGLVVTFLATILPALRAARLSPLVAMRQAEGPQSVAGPLMIRRDGLGALAARLGLPVALRLGVNDAFVRPVRGVMTTIAVIIGVATLTFTTGMLTTTGRIAVDPGFAGQPDITIQRIGNYSDAALMATLQAQPETNHIFGLSGINAAVNGLSSPVLTLALRGDPASLGYHLISGRWFTSLGEAVSGEAFAKEAHLKLGDTFTAVMDNQPITLTLVGTYFDTNNFGRMLRIGWSDYLRVRPNDQPSDYIVQLRAGADPQTYADRVAATAPDNLSVTPRTGTNYPAIEILNVVLLILAIVLGAVAIAGVFNTALLTTRERVRDIAVLKALGMTPGQVMSMVSAGAGVVGLIGSAIGVPLGIWLHRTLLNLMGQAVGDPLPDLVYHNVFQPAILAVLALGGILAALLGAFLPAREAARQPVVATLQAE